MLVAAPEFKGGLLVRHWSLFSFPAAVHRVKRTLTGRVEITAGAFLACVPFSLKKNGLVPVLGLKDRDFSGCVEMEGCVDLQRGGERVLCAPRVRTLPFAYGWISPVGCGSAALGTLTKGNVNHPKGQEACIHHCLCCN